MNGGVGLFQIVGNTGADRRIRAIWSRAGISRNVDMK